MTIPIALIATLLLVLSAQVAADSSNSDELTPIINYVLLDEGEVETPISPGTYLENNGLIVIEMESTDAPSPWQEKSGDEAIGGYLEWGGSNNFNTPGQGLISIRVAISNPGMYRFIWRNSIREGTDSTESNDSWLKILADNFYGYRESDDSTVCPRDQPSSNRCSGGAPNGSSKDGWFKVFRSGGPTLTWFWRSFTSDRDGHLIFADFDRVGEYEIQISGRSQHHAIDRLVLFRSGNASDNVLENFATDSARPESEISP